MTSKLSPGLQRSDRPEVTNPLIEFYERLLVKGGNFSDAPQPAGQWAAELYEKHAPSLSQVNLLYLVAHLSAHVPETTLRPNTIEDYTDGSSDPVSGG